MFVAVFPKFLERPITVSFTTRKFEGRFEDSTFGTRIRKTERRAAFIEFLLYAWNIQRMYRFPNRYFATLRALKEFNNPTSKSFRVSKGERAVAGTYSSFSSYASSSSPSSSPFSSSYFFTVWRVCSSLSYTHRTIDGPCSIWLRVDR